MQQSTNVGLFTFPTLGVMTQVNLDPVNPGRYDLIICKRMNTGVPGDNYIVALSYNLSISIIGGTTTWYVEPITIPNNVAYLSSVTIPPLEPNKIIIIYADGDILTHEITSTTGATTIQNTGLQIVYDVTVLQHQMALMVGLPASI